LIEPKAITETPIERPENTSVASKPSKLSKLSMFRKKQPPLEEKTRLVNKSEEQIQKDQKDKELIMKYRKMTEEEADNYLEQKKTEKGGTSAEKGLRALGMALAPVRL